MTSNFGQQVYSQGSGTASTTLFDAVRLPRNPTSGDNSYPLGKFWVNTTSNAVWYLASYTGSPTGNFANWSNLSAGSILAGVDTINTISPDGSGNFTLSSSNGSITISPIANGLDLTTAASPTVYQGNSGGNVTPNPVGQILTINGNNSSGINVVGNSPLYTLTVTAMQATTTQQGTLTLATNAQAIAGTDTMNAVTSAALGAKLGTQTAHSLAVFEGTASALTALGVGTNGQVLIGATAADPAFATLTSSDSSISFTTGANTLSLQVAGGSTTIKTISGNSGGAESPSAGNFNILGTGSITVAGSANTETVQLTGLTNHNVLIGAGTATITNVAPAATSGIPLISQGAAADPTFGTAVVAGGGTGITSATAYAVLCGGTTSTNPFQSIASVGTSGQILTSNGAGALPTFQTGAASSITLTGDTGGGLTGSSFTFNAHANCGSSVFFTGSGTTLSLKVTDASANTIIGSTAGNGTLSGTNNTSVGQQTLAVLTSGGTNCAFGLQALVHLTSGSQNVALGANSLGTLTTSGNNTAIGYNTLGSLVTGSGNIAIGMSAGGNYTTSESNNIVLSSQGVTAESNTIRIGIPGTQTACYIAGIEGVSVSNLNYVTINTATGQLGSAASATANITITGDSGGGLTASSFTFTGGTTGLTFSGAGTTETLTGTLVVANGGTGRTTLTNHGVLVGAGTSAITQLAAATNNQILVGNTSADPSFKAFSINIQTFTSSGTYTPTSGMVYCIIEAVGGGGGGGGAASASATLGECGGGGGGGGYARKFASASTIGASQTVTIGAAGSAGAAGNNAGGNGGDSSLAAICIGKGGTGGGGAAANAPGAGGAGGVAGTGDITFAGMPGGTSQSVLYSNNLISTTCGGNSYFGSGGVAIWSNNANTTGSAGQLYGGGGGGGLSVNAGGTQAGAAGAKGVVIVTEYVIS